MRRNCPEKTADPVISGNKAVKLYNFHKIVKENTKYRGILVKSAEN